MTESRREKAFTFLAATLISAAVSYGVAMIQVGPTQDRQAKLETTVQFALSTNGIVSLSSDFLGAITQDADLSSAKAELRRELGVQLNSAQSILPMFGPGVRDAADKYMEELQAFSAIIGRIDNALNIGEWAVALDQVVIAHGNLQGAMLGEIAGKQQS